ncbi:MAG TPA: hypothetical protein VLL52_13555 [Anaerolineae bacterium]|nr:hypothetical protein [Anaerolineae bacterium]
MLKRFSGGWWEEAERGRWPRGYDERGEMMGDVASRERSVEARGGGQARDAASLRVGERGML